eukprot:gene4688-6188_t
MAPAKDGEVSADELTDRFLAAARDPRDASGVRRAQWRICISCPRWRPVAAPAALLWLDGPAVEVEVLGAPADLALPPAGGGAAAEADDDDWSEENWWVILLVCALLCAAACA